MKPLSDNTSGPRDFEFLYGEWMVSSRRLQRPLAGCDEWETVDALQKCWPLLNGLGNVDELTSDDGGPLNACLRFYDPRTNLWSIYSVSSLDGIAQPPVRGAFSGSVGEFHSEDQLNGRPVLVRDRWTDTTTDRPRWERSLSADGGRTWETNWIMELSRVYWPLEAGSAPDWSGRAELVR